MKKLIIILLLLVLGLNGFGQENMLPDTLEVKKVESLKRPKPWLCGTLDEINLDENVFGQGKDLKYEQIALDWFLNECSKTDSTFLELKIITDGNTSGYYTQYRDFCGDWFAFSKDSLYVFNVSKTHEKGYRDNYIKQTIIQLKVEAKYSKPKKIKKKEIKKRNLLEITSIDQKTEFKGFYYISINTRYIHDSKGYHINIKLDKKGNIVDYSISLWIA